MSMMLNKYFDDLTLMFPLLSLQIKTTAEEPKSSTYQKCER